MMKNRMMPGALAALVMAAMPVSVSAAPPRSSVPGWQDMIDSVQTLPDRMLAKLPDDMRRNPQVQQEAARLALESLAAASLEAIAADGDAPQFMPSIGQVLNVGQPNADTIYRSARLTPGGSYRLTGKVGSLNHAVVAQAVPGAGMRAHLFFSQLKSVRKGRYDVLLSAARPAGYRGDWWQLDPAANRLMVRMVSSDWAGEQAPTIVIERTDQPPAARRRSAADLEQRLRGLPRQTDAMALMFIDHVAQLRQAGVVNTLKVFNVTAGALQGQFYYEGAFDLGDNEALIIESPLPAKCQYRSLILTNDVYETIDWVNNHSSLNDAQAAPDADGVLRIVVAAKDPGVKNWLDTAGHQRGVVQGRWTGCSSQPIPAAHKVKAADLMQHLPKGVAQVTPAQRETILRERRRAYLERPQW